MSTTGYGISFRGEHYVLKLDTDDAFKTERYPAQPVSGKYAVWHGYGEEQEGSRPQPSREGGVASPWTGLESEGKEHVPSMLCSFCVLRSQVNFRQCFFPV